MTYTNIVLTHSRDGFSLFKEERSHFKDTILDVTDRLCALTGHRWCHRFGYVWDWAEPKNFAKGPVPIPDETAYALSDEGDWAWLTEDDEGNDDEARED